MVGTLPGGAVHYALGYTGNGVAPSHLCARILADMATGERTPLTELPLGPGRRLPPEPLRVLGGEAVRVALDRQERAEERGVRPSAAARMIARLPGLLGVHIDR